MQFQQPSNPFGLDRYRGVAKGFLAGVVVGAFIGWFFHGLVGMLIRFGFVLVLLIPLALVVWYFFLRQPAAPRQGGGPGGMQVFTWSSGQGSRGRTPGPARQRPNETPPAEPERPARDSDVIDIEFEELKRQVNDEERRS
jgi:hypothetical protein